MTPPPELSISSVFSEMKDGAESHRGTLIRITLVFATLAGASISLELLGATGVAISLGASVLLGAAYSGMVAALISDPGKTGSAGETWALVRPVLSRLIWASLLVAVAIFAGLILLVVPGLILLTIWSVVVPVIVVEKLSVMDSLSRSRELVRGNGWRVFVFLFSLGLVSAVMLLLAYLVSAPLGTGTLHSIVFQFLVACVVNPLTSIGPASLYNQLTAEPEVPPQEL